MEFQSLKPKPETLCHEVEARYPKPQKRFTTQKAEQKILVAPEELESKLPPPGFSLAFFWLALRTITFWVSI